MEGVSIDGSLLSNYGVRLWENAEFGPGTALPPQRVVRLWERTVGVRKRMPESSDVRRGGSAEDQSGLGKGAVEGEVGGAQDKYILGKFKSVWETKLLGNLIATDPCNKGAPRSRWTSRTGPFNICHCGCDLS